MKEILILSTGLCIIGLGIAMYNGEIGYPIPDVNIWEMK